MNWDKLDLHIENLIPGIVLISVLMAGWHFPLGDLQNSEGLIIAAFIGVAYMSGAVSNVLARLLLDIALTKTLRPYFMRFFLTHRLEKENHQPKDINKRYSAVITAGLSCGNNRIEAEVAKRRQTGRILRSTLIPSLLAIIAISQHQNWSNLKTTGTGIGAYIAILIIYGYAEVVVFQEGYRGEKVKGNSGDT